jgi:hypothetical protein
MQPLPGPSNFAWRANIRHRLAIVAAAGIGLWAGTAWAAPAGTVVGLSGDCMIEHGGNRGVATLSQGIDVGDSIEVAAGGKMKLRMADGSVVSVAAGTRMTVTAYGITDAGQRQNAQLSLSRGLLHIEVTPVTSGPPAPFEVETAVGTAAVRSTDWFVEATPNDMQVNVQIGTVEMTNRQTGHGVTIPARAGSRMQRGIDPAPPRRINRSVFLALSSRTLVIERRRLRNGRVGPVPQERRFERHERPEARRPPVWERDNGR